MPRRHTTAFATLAAAVITLAFLAPRPAAAQRTSGADPAAAAPAEVLVLGVFHMANPGRDLFNTQADDMLSEKRQTEMAALIEALKRFRPTKVAVEAGFSSSVVPRRYAEYRAGTYELTRNETDQIGFRLAQELGHDSIYAVDVDGEFPYMRLVDYVKAHGQSAEFDTLMAELGTAVEAQSAYLASHTVLETLLYMNADERVAEDVGFYYRQAHFGEPWNWAGPDLVADWFRRNARIYGNIVHLADAPGERILVVYGAGHLGWLRQMFASDPLVRLRKLDEFAR